MTAFPAGHGWLVHNGVVEVAITTEIIEVVSGAQALG